jgi:UDP-glucuronate decarboxylase
MHPADGRIVSNFIVQALKNEPITLYGDGEQTRSFCYVDDLIDGLIRLMDTPAAFTGPVNLGNPGEFTMRELPSDAGRNRFSVANCHTAAAARRPRQRQPDIWLAKARLGWAPRIALREGLKPTVDYFPTLCWPAMFPQR